MKFIPAKIPGVFLIEPKVYRDDRGFFMEEYNEEALRKQGIQVQFVQGNHSLSSKGTLRGLHYQLSPHAQAKLIRVVRGEVLDVAVDIRKNSKTFGHYVSHVLSEENKRMVYIPVGFAHGFFALKDHSEVMYRVSEFYSPGDQRGILWNDPDIGIEWPKTGGEVLLSDKDKNLPLLKDAETF